jgi:HPt (histidine-containing phosphotransfer) domain-containing protein
MYYNDEQLKELGEKIAKKEASEEETVKFMSDFNELLSQLNQELKNGDKEKEYELRKEMGLEE